MPLAVVRVPAAVRWYLTSPGPALRVGGDRVDRPLALELAQDVLVRRADRVREHVEPAAVRHADDDVVRACLRRQLDRLVEHRDHHVEPLDRELLLAEEPLAQEALHPLHLAQPAEERLLLLGGERLPVTARLDRLPQPHALLVVGEVLELVRDRAAVRLRELRQDVGERLAGNVHAQHGGGDLRLELGRQLRLEAQRFERGVADRLRAERVEPRREMPVRAMRLDERHRRRDAAEQPLVSAPAPAAGALGGACCGCGGASVWPLPPFAGSFSSRRAIPGCEATSAESPLSKSARHSDGTASGFSR